MNRQAKIFLRRLVITISKATKTVNATGVTGTRRMCEEIAGVFKYFYIN